MIMIIRDVGIIGNRTNAIFLHFFLFDLYKETPIFLQCSLGPLCGHQYSCSFLLGLYEDTNILAVFFWTFMKTSILQFSLGPLRRHQYSCSVLLNHYEFLQCSFEPL